MGLIFRINSSQFYTAYSFVEGKPFKLEIQTCLHCHKATKGKDF